MSPGRIAICTATAALASLAHANVPPARHLTAAPPPPLLDIHAQADVVAALECYSRGFRYMLRIGPDDVLCLHTNVAAKLAVDIPKKYPSLRRPEVLR